MTRVQVGRADFWKLLRNLTRLWTLVRRIPVNKCWHPNCTYTPTVCTRPRFGRLRFCETSHLHILSKAIHYKNHTTTTTTTTRRSLEAGSLSRTQGGLELEILLPLPLKYSDYSRLAYTVLRVEVGKRTEEIKEFIPLKWRICWPLSKGESVWHIFYLRVDIDHLFGKQIHFRGTLKMLELRVQHGGIGKRWSGESV